MTPNIYRGEICLVNFGGNVGSEQAGIRPAVIVQNNIGNEHSPTTIVCPLTSREKSPVDTHVVLTPEDANLLMESIVLCEQIRTIDKARIVKKLGEIQNLEKLKEINRKLFISVGLEG